MKCLGPALVVFVLWSAPARADVQACFDAALRGQELRRDGKLLAARDAFIACGRPECPEAVVRSCTAWLTEATEALPTVTLSAGDAEGKEVTDARVSVDGLDAPPALAGRAVPLDPGPHVAQWRRPDGVVAVQRFVVREHEKGRNVRAIFPVPMRTHVPAGTYALGATAAVAAGVFAFFGVRGVSDRASFGCNRTCSAEEYDQVRREFVAADVTLGISVLSLAGAAWLYWQSRTPAQQTVTVARAAPGAWGIGIPF